MNSASGYAEQYTQSLDKDVSQNKLSMPEYYSKKEKLLDSLLSGEESVETCTTGNSHKDSTSLLKNVPKFPRLVNLVGKNFSQIYWYKILQKFAVI